MKEKEKEKTGSDKVKEETDIGTIRINNEVIGVIAGRAATEAKGVAGMSGGVVDGLAKMLGRRNPEKGVRVEIADDGVSVDISILVHYGVSIPDLCAGIQRTVKKRIEEMTGKNVKTVNVNVHGIHFPASDEKGEEEKT